jgi:hypothetical protein
MSIRSNEVRVALAQHEDCLVSLCEHGCVHVTVGSVTTHLSRHAFELLCLTLFRAQQRLALDEAGGCAGRPI